MSVSVTNRHTSSFEITLTMACDPSDNMVESYTCDVSNRLGGDNQTHSIGNGILEYNTSEYIMLFVPGLQIECDRSEFVVSETVNCSCSSEIEHSTVKWREQDAPSADNVFLTIPVTTDSQGEVFTCLMNSSCVAQEKTLTVDVTSKCVFFFFRVLLSATTVLPFQFLMSGLLLTSRTPLERMPSTTLTTS